jgi:hypothetical protein
MRDVRPSLTLRDILRYGIAYMFWLLAAVSALAAMLMARSALNVLWPTVGLSHWVLRPVDRFGLLFLGILWLVYVIFCEHHYRTSITEVRIRRDLRSTANAAPRPVPQAGALSDEDAGGGKLARALADMGLDILARRLVPTLVIPLILLAAVYAIYRLSFVLLVR